MWRSLASMAACAAAAIALASAPASAKPKSGTAPASAGQTPPASTSAGQTSAGAASKADSVALKGGEAGTVFDEMTIQGEDRIRIEFERPDLQLEVDPRTAPGLDGNHLLEVLDRAAPTAASPLLARSALERSPSLARPWLRQLATGPVARFQPKVEGAVHWSLRVADSRGQTVASFEGDNRVPRDITWDGLTRGGDPAAPGLVYSYVFEAFDRAGNKRSFLGDGFQIRPYLRRDEGSLRMVFTGKEMEESGAAPPAILIEAAGWLNQIEKPASPVRIEARAQSLDQAQALADRALAGIKPLVLGDPARLQSFTVVESDSPAAGVVSISAAL